MGNGVFDGFRNFKWEDRGARGLVMSAIDEVGELVLIGDVRRNKKAGGNQWEAEVVTPQGESLDLSTRRSSVSGACFVEAVVRKHGGNIPESFANYVIRRREELGWSQARLGKEAGLHSKTIWDIEIRGKQPSDEMKAKLIAVLGERPGRSSELNPEDSTAGAIQALKAEIKALREEVQRMKEGA